MKLPCFLTFLSAGILRSGGAELEALPDMPWLGYWVGYENSKWDAGIGTSGEGVLYLKKDRERTKLLSNYEIIYLLKEKINGKWTRPKMVEDGFETEQKSTDEPKKVEFIATYEFGAQTRFRQDFSSRGI